MASDKKILVVDDEPRMIEFITMNLELEGFRVVSASDGYQAVEKVTRELPDLVILDVMMPDMDGFETLKRIRQVSSVPVIFLSVKGEEFDRVRGLDLGADDYITKPFSPRELVSRVRGKEIPLRPTEHRLLYQLVSNAGRLLSHETLLSRVWGPEYRDEDHYVRLYITYLRQKIEKDPKNPKYILSERGLGYRFKEFNRPG